MSYAFSIQPSDYSHRPQPEAVREEADSYRAALVRIHILCDGAPPSWGHLLVEVTLTGPDDVTHIVANTHGAPAQVRDWAWRIIRPVLIRPYGAPIH